MSVWHNGAILCTKDTTVVSKLWGFRWQFSYFIFVRVNTVYRANLSKSETRCVWRWLKIWPTHSSMIVKLCRKYKWRMLYKIGLSKLMLLVVVIELQASLVSISLNFSKKLHSRASVTSFETYITFQILQGMLSNMANTFLGSTVSENHVFVRYLSLEKIVFMGTWLPKPKSD
jgi:hypothetical protein